MKTVAVVGLSDKPERPSYQVAQYLVEAGFTVIPVNPSINEWLGRRAYPTISDIPPEIQIDVVDVFRQPEYVMAVIDDVLKSGRRPFIWLQEGVGSVEAQEYAQTHGLKIVMDVCMMKKKITPDNMLA